MFRLDEFQKLDQMGVRSNIWFFYVKSSLFLKFATKQVCMANLQTLDVETKTQLFE